MTDRKEFACPKCEGKSWLDPGTLVVEHSEPKCAAWLAMEEEQQNQPGPKPANEVEHDSGTFAVPTVVDFLCPECSKPARMFPRAEPIGVEHSLPVCALWETVGKKDDVERYLIKAGMHIHVPDVRE